ncbi:DNA mismatch repair protein MSH1, mitochondrial-like, partial [Olea europaea var. sylvestris]|uniref:DNA mismatch repair protein MSH1, mitochondrial-like n=1 Tax=Olea europaea var. sylvestris TaxID=158386 RepID=UPI000C1CF48F
DGVVTINFRSYVPHLMYHLASCHHLLFLSNSIRQSERILRVKERKYYIRTTKKQKQLKNVLEEKDYAHIMWWKERIQMCRKPSSVLLVKRLTYSNLLGIDTSLRNGR